MLNTLVEKVSLDSNVGRVKGK
eukprot:SAG11_NODE_31894_length_288_cov_0.814815_1_plen_21_part_01